MTNYKKNTINLGYSDIAMLTIVSPRGASSLKFGGDGNYKAYVVYGPMDARDIPHYTQVYTANSWVWLFDDDGKKTAFTGDMINIYRAGDYGMIINICYAPRLSLWKDGNKCFAVNINSDGTTQVLKEDAPRLQNNLEIYNYLCSVNDFRTRVWETVNINDLHGHAVYSIGF